MKNGPATIGEPVFNYDGRLKNSIGRRYNYAAAASTAEERAERSEGAVSTK